MSASEQRKYRVGPVERRGLIGSLRAALVIVIAAGLRGGVLGVRWLGGGDVATEGLCQPDRHLP